MRNMVKRIAALAVFVMLTAAGAAWGQEAKSFAVLPFEVHGPEKYQYLSQGIQSMLISRLNWPEHFEAVDKATSAKAQTNAPQSTKQALEIAKRLGVDYLLWGSVTVMGDDASLDLEVQDDSGNSWPESATVKMSELIPKLEQMASNVNSEIFKRPGTGEKKAAKKTEVARVNPDLVYNEARADESFALNPQFRYEGGADTKGRWRSQSMPYKGVGMVVDDLDADGRTEVAILTTDKVRVYRYVESKLQELGAYDLPARVSWLRINSLDTNRDGQAEMFVTGYSGDEPWTVVLTFDGQQFTVEHERIKLFINAVQMPPDYSWVLVGQKKGNVIPIRSSVHELTKVGGEYELGRSVKLPELSNVYNFGYLPTGDGSYKIIQVDTYDKLKVYEGTKEVLSSTGEPIANSPIGYEFIKGRPGMGQGNPERAERWEFWVPLRLLVTRLTPEKRYDLLLGKNISMAAQFFQAFRNYPYSEMHATFWDGVGLSLIWKTRRIKGSILDYTIADADNDGKKEMCVLISSYTGMAGIDARRTSLLGYEMDFGKGENKYLDGGEDEQ